MTFTYTDKGGGTRLCRSECDGMSQCNLTEDDNRLTSAIAEGQVNPHAYVKGQVNLYFVRKKLREVILFLIFC